MDDRQFDCTWQEYAAQIGSFLSGTQVSDVKGQGIEVNEAFFRLTQFSKRCRENDAEIIFVGNGASATMASHLSADIFKNAHIRTRVLTDVALLTAMGNDICYEQVYAAPLKLLLRTQDILVAISSSGSSPNILEAARVARAKESCVVTFSAFSEDNPLRKIGHMNFFVGAQSFGFAESCHASLLHYWMDCIALHD